ncbi:hypothetical protein HX017_15405 [Myroides marinus]|uniref:hypothetical protein n=1 Tax=Myroides TaxID=76831 RepID=UPI00257578C3|nr:MULTISPECIES: hypothetical protein [Myroides]MDM1033807.1 hypothetical protein [Myroides odoratimimus]MDM1366327.1 hypothetical protein [Myroides marinus]
MNTDEKTIYDLKLHEAITLNVKINGDKQMTIMVTRVPGGFLYHANDLDMQTFVPFNDEFKNSDNTGNYAIV